MISSEKLTPTADAAFVELKKKHRPMDLDVAFVPNIERPTMSIDEDQRTGWDDGMEIVAGFSDDCTNESTGAPLTSGANDFGILRSEKLVTIIGQNQSSVRFQGAKGYEVCVFGLEGKKLRLSFRLAIFRIDSKQILKRKFVDFEKYDQPNGAELSPGILLNSTQPTR